MEKFQGIFSILPTPLQEDGELDLKGLEKLIEHNLSGGVNGIVVLGSNGEFPYFSFEEKKQIIQRSAQVLKTANPNPGVPLMVGASSLFTKEAVELSVFAQAQGAEGLLIILPSYYRVGFGEILRHYQTICSAVRIPVFYYHYPETSGNYLSVEQFVEILKLPGIMGAKNSQLQLGYFKKLLNQTRGLGKAIFTGVEFNLKRTLELGAVGSMGPLANIWPEKLREIFQGTRAGRDSEAERAQKELFCLMPILGGPVLPNWLGERVFNWSTRPVFRKFYHPKPTIALIKEALRQLGVPITAMVRAPLPQLTKEDQKLVEKSLGRMKAISSA